MDSQKYVVNKLPMFYTTPQFSDLCKSKFSLASFSLQLVLIMYLVMDTSLAADPVIISGVL